jgi:hypothetical protein
MLAPEQLLYYSTLSGAAAIREASLNLISFFLYVVEIASCKHQHSVSPPQILVGTYVEIMV